jgi:hypothetical protein
MDATDKFAKVFLQLAKANKRSLRKGYKDDPSVLREQFKRINNKVSKPSLYPVANHG